MNKVYVIKNRYRIDIQFIEVNSNNLIMIVPKNESDYVRTGWINSIEGHEIVCYVDPSGGPFIQRGMNIGDLIEECKDKIVQAIIPIKSGQYKGHYNIVIV